MLESVDNERALFISKEGQGYSCLGFQVCAERTNRIKRELESLTCLGADIREEVENMPQLHGTKEAYDQYMRLIDICRLVNTATGYRFKCNLTDQLIGLEGRRVEVVAHGEKSRFNVGKSTGFMPCHIELKTKRSSGGMAANRHYDQVRIVG